jgi:hypothetical protein
MESAVGSWKDVFGRWPTEAPHRGVLVVDFGEQIPFAGFVASPGFLLVQRQTPDSMGARSVMLPYGVIQGLKIIDVIQPGGFKPLGFDGVL